MSAIQRQSRTSDIINHDSTDPAGELVLSHESFVGISIQFTSATTFALAVDNLRNGNFADAVTLEGSGKWKYPDQAGMDVLYNAAFVKITWDAGPILVFQKG